MTGERFVQLLSDYIDAKVAYIAAGKGFDSIYVRGKKRDIFEEARRKLEEIGEELANAVDEISGNV